MSQLAVYGGSGGLGRVLVNYFKSKGYSVINIDLVENTDADRNAIVNGQSSMEEQGSQVMDALNSLLKDNKLDAILCVAGGWAGFLKSANLMIKQSVESSCIAAHIATKYLKQNGLLALTGAAAAADATPGMIGYGIAKSAVHHLVKDLAGANSGLPTDAKVTAICPITIDTPMNRKAMPQADISTWTPPEHIAKQLHDYLTGATPLENGKLIKVVTQNGESTFSEL
ncbi:uncharacterized protein BYT42DRAFT_499937 [Radiomyces spectabilis]|uniref:uncharacterized protein n=1 Tax=Radiomyces spectabilis TaxID=64574 RepID=UPI002220B503|nr:uncharacterized protein BYT42DRAFT_499937 [Radiomyces spectabilis]KAI8374515.1 hypothetical protein BYT42DRAFT_499937 [Radiomyces spectabilis]